MMLISTIGIVLLCVHKAMCDQNIALKDDKSEDKEKCEMLKLIFNTTDQQETQILKYIKAQNKSISELVKQYQSHVNLEKAQNNSLAVTIGSIAYLYASAYLIKYASEYKTKYAPSVDPSAFLEFFKNRIIELFSSDRKQPITFKELTEPRLMSYAIGCLDKIIVSANRIQTDKISLNVVNPKTLLINTNRKITPILNLNYNSIKTPILNLNYNSMETPIVNINYNWMKTRKINIEIDFNNTSAANEKNESTQKSNVTVWIVAMISAILSMLLIGIAVMKARKFYKKKKSVIPTKAGD